MSAGLLRMTPLLVPPCIGRHVIKRRKIKGMQGNAGLAPAAQIVAKGFTRRLPIPF